MRRPQTPSTEPPDGPAAVLPALDGLRAVAALGVLLTHVAFQTGAVAEGAAGAVLARLDLAVAVFFALSGFLLWRPWAATATGAGPRPAVLPYLRARAARVLPAYVVLVVVVLWLLPENAGAGGTAWGANLSLTQVYVPLALAPGLTHTWSLCVEVAFYLALPLLGLALVRFRRRGTRVAVMVALAGASLGWHWLRVEVLTDQPADLWLPAQLPWFLAGTVLAELTAGPGRARAASAGWWAPAWLALAALALVVASTPLGGPRLLVAPTAAQAATKTVLGTVLAVALLVPLVTGGSGAYRQVLSCAPARTLGRWSYGLFLWHLAVLAVVFPVLGLPQFSGHLLLVLATTVLLSVPVAAASYALVEEPARRRWGRRDPGTATAPTTTSATSASSWGSGPSPA